MEQFIVTRHMIGKRDRTMAYHKHIKKFGIKCISFCCKPITKLLMNLPGIFNNPVVLCSGKIESVYCKKIIFKVERW